MASTQGSSDDDVISAINITPLVDVVLVLLVIFMITAPVIYQNAIKVKLPTAQNAEKTDSSPMDFTLSKDGKISWGKDLLTWESFEERLKNTPIDQLKTETAMIRADEATPHGQVIRLIDLCRKYGLTKFALNVSTPRKI